MKTTTTKKAMSEVVRDERAATIRQSIRRLEQDAMVSSTVRGRELAEERLSAACRELALYCDDC